MDGPIHVDWSSPAIEGANAGQKRPAAEPPLVTAFRDWLLSEAAARRD